MGKRAEQAIARLSELLGQSPQYDKIQGLSDSERAELNTLYAALHKARRFDLLGIHAVPWIQVTLRERYKGAWRKFLGPAYQRVADPKKSKKKISVIERWNPDKAEFGTWIGLNAWGGASDEYKAEKRADLVQGISNVDKKTRAQLELTVEIRSDLGNNDGDIDDDAAAGDAWLWQEQFEANQRAEFAEATPRELELFDSLSDRQRSILLGKHEGLKDGEIATQVRCGIRTVEREKSRIRDLLDDASVTLRTKSWVERIVAARSPNLGRIEADRLKAERDDQLRKAAEDLFKPRLASDAVRLARPVLTSDLDPAYKPRMKSIGQAPPWKAAYWAFKRRGVDITEEQVKTDKFFSLPITYREAHEIFDDPTPEWLKRVLEAQPEPVGLSQAPEDMRPDPDAARRLSESLKGWQKSKHGHGGSRPAPAVET